MAHSAQVIDTIEKLTVAIQGIIKSSSKWYEKLDHIVTLVVPEVESIGETLKGEDKKQLATEIIESLWFKFGDIKYIPNFIEKPLVHMLVSKSIDALVAQFNKMGIFKHKTV